MGREHHVAIHEAGHAVVAIVRGRNVLRVTIAAETRACYHPDSKPDAIVSLAGLIAQARFWLAEFNQQELDELAKDHFGGDKQAAAESIAEGFGGSCDRREAVRIVGEGGLPGKMVEARAIVEENWNAIERVADALMLDGTLDGAAVAALVKQATA